MNKNLFAYKVGLGVIGLFVIIMAIIVIMQANGTKQDNNTDKAANKIATKLNTFITDRQVIPESLAAAGINDVPSTITYKKLDAGSYKFCATYKANSSGFDATGAVLDAATSASAVDNSGSDGYNQSYTKYSLYIDPTHHKGENCQTIKPIIYNSHPSICSYTYQSSTSIACPAIDPSIYTPTNNSSKVCGYQITPSASCSNNCPQYVQPSIANLFDGEVTSATKNGTDLNITIKTKDGAAILAVINSNTLGYDDGCKTIDATAVSVGNKVRINVSDKAVASKTTLYVRELVDFSNSNASGV